MIASWLARFTEQGFGNDYLLIPRRTVGGGHQMDLSHGAHSDQSRSAIAQASPLRHLVNRHGRNLLGALMVAVIVFAAALSAVSS
jgi:hypothetical protein